MKIVKTKKEIPINFAFVMKGGKKKSKMATYILSGGFTLLLIGVLFRVFHRPDHFPLLFCGILLVITGTATLFVLNPKK